jgi:phosphatidate cytidylyltransferase
MHETKLMPAEPKPEVSNLTQRVIVALIAAPLLMVDFYVGGIYFLIFALAVSSASLWEFLTMTEAKAAQPKKYFTVAVGFLITGSFYFNITPERFLIAFVVCSTAIELFRDTQKRLENLGAEFVGLFYISLSFALLVALRERFASHYLVMMMIVSVWASDTFAYFGGVLLGGKIIKRKFFERISPKKTWEGFFAGVGGTMAIAHLFFIWFLEAEGFQRKDILAIALLVGLFGPIGDLIESMFKRDTGVKDSSGLIPGHGGVFDRFDALIFVTPLVYLYAVWFM